MNAGNAPQVLPGGLVTVAFLKAQLDGRNDHLGIFTPLVLSAITTIRDESFTTSRVQNALTRAHKLVLSQQAIEILLKRAVKQGILERTPGRYKVQQPISVSASTIDDKTKSIRHGQDKLALALVDFARGKGIDLSSDEAMDILLAFIHDEHVAMLLNSPPPAIPARETTVKRTIVAEFIQGVVQDDPDMKDTIGAILEGLVLYYASFLPNLGTANQRFSDLRVYFDSDIIRQALGYEGTALQTLQREIIRILLSERVRCLVFDQTLEEIDRILAYYERNLTSGTPFRQMHQTRMTRQFSISRYSNSDIREMRALLRERVEELGVEVAPMPLRLTKTGAVESALQSALANRTTRDETAPRVKHDVDCVMSILAIRKDHSSSRLEDARAVFVSGSAEVIDDVRNWYRDAARGAGVEPMVHVRALANLAWLKQPRTAATFKLHELIALCSAALQPRPETWQRFLRHLENQQRDERLSSEQATMILISRLSDLYLSEAESENVEDLDANTLDEIVERIQSSLSEKYDAELAKISKQIEDQKARADIAEREIANRAQHMAERSQRWSSNLATAVYWSALTVAILGSVLLIREYTYRIEPLGVLAGTALILVVLAEIYGVFTHLRQFRRWLAQGLRRYFDGHFGVRQ